MPPFLHTTNPLSRMQRVLGMGTNPAAPRGAPGTWGSNLLVGDPRPAAILTSRHVQSWLRLDGSCIRRKGQDAAHRAKFAAPRTAATDVAVTDTPAVLDNAAVAMDDKDELSLLALLRFVLPTCGVWVIAPVLSLVDTAVVGTRSTIELGALGPATMLCDYLAYIFTFLTIAVTNRVSICISRRNLNGAGNVVSNSLGLGAALGLGLSVVLMLISSPVLSLIAGKASAQLVAPATAYVRLRTLGLIGFMVGQVGQGFFLAAEDPITPLLALSVAGIGNLFLDLLLVNSFGMGIRGAALATAAAQIASAAILLVRLFQPLRFGSLKGTTLPVKWTMPKFQPAMRFMSSCGSVIGMLVAKVVMYSLLTSIATGLSPVSSGAHHVVFSLFLFFCFVGEGIGMAAQAFLPRFVGKPKKAWGLALSLQKSAVFVATFLAMGAGLFLLCCPFLFTKSPAIAAQMIQLVPFFSAVMFFHAASMMTEGLLLAGQDTRFLAASYGANIFFCLLTVGFLRWTGLGLPAVWWTILQFQALRLVINWARMQQKGSVLNRTTPLPDQGS